MSEMPTEIRVAPVEIRVAPDSESVRTGEWTCGQWWIGPGGTRYYHHDALAAKDAEIARCLQEISELRFIARRAFIEGHDAGYSCGCAKVERPDAHNDWLASRARAALGEP